MKPTRIMTVLLGIAAFAATGIGAAAEKFDFGKREYDNNCAVCHGKQGKGDGPYAGLVDTRIADLTVLTRNNKGAFPFDRVYQTIDGRLAVKAHGPRDMPIWGDRYLRASAETYMEVPYDPEAFVRTRILALVEYISRLQVR